MLKWIRKLSRNGHSNTVTLPAQALDHLRLEHRDYVAITLTERMTLELRRAAPSDFMEANISPTLIAYSAEGSK